MISLADYVAFFESLVRKYIPPNTTTIANPIATFCQKGNEDLTPAFAPLAPLGPSNKRKA